MSILGLRTIPMGINQNLNSCWLAATLQAIVDCPLLVNAIFNTINYESERVEIEKKKIYLEILTIMSELIEAETALLQNKYSFDLYQKDQIVINGIKVLKSYPLNSSNLMRSDLGKMYIMDKTYTMFIELSKLKILDWIQILNRSEDSLEELIKKKIIDLPFEKLLEYYKIFNFYDTENMPLLWRSLEFNNLLKKYLYALIFNNNTSLSCLNPQIFKKNMFDSMTNVLCLLESEIKLEFVDRVLSQASNPLIFLSIMFENLRNTTFTKNLPLFKGRIINRGMSILLPSNITRFSTINSMIIDDEVVFDPQIKSIDSGTGKFTNDYNFLIITNSTIETLREAHTSLSEGARHDFITEQEITVFDVQYTLCSVIIHLGGIHYVTLTQVGEFNDGRFKLGNSKLQEFCLNSKYVEQTGIGTKNHPGYIWFYQKKVEISSLEQIKKNAHEMYKDELIYHELLEVCGISSSDLESKSAWYNKVGSDGDNIIGKLMYQFNDYTIIDLIGKKYLEPEDYLKDIENSEERRTFLQNILAESKPNLPEDLSTTSLVSSERFKTKMPMVSTLPETYSLLNKSWNRVNDQQFLECQRQQQQQLEQFQPLAAHSSVSELRYIITSDDLNRTAPNTPYIYFNRFTIEEINKFFNTTFSHENLNISAYEFFSKGNVKRLLMENNEKFKKLMENFMQQPKQSQLQQIYSGKASPFTVKESELSTVFKSTQDVFLTREEKNYILELAKDDFFELFPNFKNEDVSRESLTEMLLDTTITNNQEMLTKIMKGGYSHSKQQKYLKYKNKYLQLKRMEKNKLYISLNPITK